MEQLLAILRAAIKEIPPVKYALGVAGIAAAGALITGVVGYNRAGIIILAGTFVAMILLFIFANMVMSPTHQQPFPDLFFSMW